jgi:iron complex outermembrane receptor protein
MAVGVARAQGEAAPPEPVPTVAADAPAAPAASEPATDANVPRNRVMAGEIIVTAQKREESIQEVPISIQAFTPETLDAKGIHSVPELTRVTSGLQFGSFAGFPLVFLRGVGTDVFLPTEDPSVTTYIDGIYIPMSQGVAQGLGGIERVEVLKGPQGTLFGRNSTGGAISIVTRKPGDEFETTGVGEVGHHDERRA